MVVVIHSFITLHWTRARFALVPKSRQWVTLLSHGYPKYGPTVMVQMVEVHFSFMYVFEFKLAIVLVGTDARRDINHFSLVASSSPYTLSKSSIQSLPPLPPPRSQTRQCDVPWSRLPVWLAQQVEVEASPLVPRLHLVQPPSLPP